VKNDYFRRQRVFSLAWLGLRGPRDSATSPSPPLLKAQISSLHFQSVATSLLSQIFYYVLDRYSKHTQEVLGKVHILCQESDIGKLLIAKRFFLMQNSGNPAIFQDLQKFVAKKCCKWNTEPWKLSSLLKLLLSEMQSFLFWMFNSSRCVIYLYISVFDCRRRNRDVFFSTATDSLPTGTTTLVHQYISSLD